MKVSRKLAACDNFHRALEKTLKNFVVHGHKYFKKDKTGMPVYKQGSEKFVVGNVLLMWCKLPWTFVSEGTTDHCSRPSRVSIGAVLQQIVRPSNSLWRGSVRR